jgi:hypothetical protein
MEINKKSQVRLVTGIAIIAFGTLAALFLGLGIALNNNTLNWIGGILMAGIPFILAIISKWII